MRRHGRDSSEILRNSETPARFERFKTLHHVASHLADVCKHDVDIAASDVGSERHRRQLPWRWPAFRHQSCEKARTAGDCCLPVASAITSFTSCATSMSATPLNNFRLSASNCAAKRVASMSAGTAASFWQSSESLFRKSNISKCTSRQGCSRSQQ